MLTYKEYVKYLINSFVRSSMFIRLGLFLIATLNNCINHAKEYWYMGSIFANVSMVKNNFVECVATIRYCCLVLSIIRSVISDSACFSFISFAKIFEELNMVTASSSSKIFPSVELRTSNILSSISFKDLKNSFFLILNIKLVI